MFKEWFKTLYVKRGFVSSEKELAEAFEAGAAAEREECAKLCDVADRLNVPSCCVAADIRARSNVN